MSRVSNLVAKAQRALAVGPRGIAQRVARRAYDATGAADLRFNLALADVLTEVPDTLPTPTERVPRTRRLRVGWVITPPAPGSGGHTTLFRMVEALQDRGHECVLFVYDRHGLDVQRLTDRLNTHWPKVRATVRDARRGIDGVDVVVATAWETAHVAVTFEREPVRRLYLMQDYEPYFYGHGAESTLSAMTYRLPFRRVALGEMLHGMVLEATGLESDVIPFGCDSQSYRPPTPPVPRSGIVFYSRLDDSRRGFKLACVALRLFHEAHPEQEIHVYGEPPRGLEVPATYHGWVSARELNDLYGRTIAGLALSFTNITLVAEEMLAAGNIPVVNDSPLARAVLPNTHVRWAEATAAALAAQLGEAVSAPDVAERADLAAASVTGRSWQPTFEAFAEIVEDEGYGSDTDDE
jgi:O-antigen biosynthesis protein